MSKSIYDCFIKMVDSNLDPFYLFNVLADFEQIFAESVYLDNILMDACEHIMNSKKIKYVEELVLFCKKKLDILDLVTMIRGANKARKLVLLCFILLKKNITMSQDDIDTSILMDRLVSIIYYNKSFTYILNCGFIIKMHDTRDTNYQEFKKNVNYLFI